jgi:hypothetical protein
MPFSIDDALKLVQIGFYVTGGAIAVLTYRAAKRGLLNSVNTEYQKRVMDRLAGLSDELFAEFDPDSEHFWAKEQMGGPLLDHVLNDFLEHKERGAPRPHLAPTQ